MTQPRGWAEPAARLGFQRLDVYQQAIEFLALAFDIVDVLNIAEGAGRWSEADSANRYKIARGEAMECAASLDVLKLRKLVSEDQYRGNRLLEGVVATLTKMI